PDETRTHVNEMTVPIRVRELQPGPPILIVFVEEDGFPYHRADGLLVFFRQIIEEPRRHFRQNNLLTRLGLLSCGFIRGRGLCFSCRVVSSCLPRGSWTRILYLYDESRARPDQSDSWGFRRERRQDPRERRGLKK